MLVSDPIDKSDFLSQDEKNPNKFSYDPVLHCNSSGLSVFTDTDGIKLAQDISRGLRQQFSIYEIASISAIMKKV
jgi:hypothetical protein